MNRTYTTVMAVTLAAAIAGFLIYALAQKGSLPGAIFVIVGLTITVAIVVLVVLTQKRSAQPAEAAAKPTKYAIGIAILGAVMAQAGGILPGMFNDKNGDGSLPWIIIATIFAAMGGVIAAASSKKGKRGELVAAKKMPWVLVMLAVMLAVGVAGTIVGIFAAPESGEQAGVMIWPFISLAILIVVSALVIKLVMVGMRSGSYALPDILPEAGPPTDPKFAKGGYWDGTRMLNQRAWGMRVPVFGRGYYIRGQGKVWLADEVLAFHLYLTRKPLVIPYGIIHGVSTKDRMYVKNRLPGPGLNIVWGRPDAPMVTTMVVTSHHAENEAWAQEIVRRAGVWKDKMAATLAEQAQ
jgi:MFS family permease